MAKTKRVLVVEDIPRSLQATVREIAGQGHAVTEVHSVSEAIRHVTTRDFDLMILDWRIPLDEGGSVDVDGGARVLDAIAARQRGSAGRGLPYVVVSAQMTTVPRSVRSDPACLAVLGKLSLTILDGVLEKALGNLPGGTAGPSGGDLGG